MFTLSQFRHGRREYRTFAESGRGVSRIAILANIAILIPTFFAAATAAAQSPNQAAPLELKKPASPQPWARYKVDSQGSSWPQTDWSAFSNIARGGVSPAPHPAPSFTLPLEGDAERGRTLAYDRARGGSCVVCHIMGKTTPAQPGNVGPDLSAIGAARDDHYLFNYVYDPRIYNANSIMPPWGAYGVYRLDEVRDIVAFLKTLKQPYAITDKAENPNTRPAPVERRDNLDPTENPGIFGLDTGKDVFTRRGSNGKSCASCHATPESSFKTWAARMPRYEPRLQRVLGVEEFITRHARATTGDEILMQSNDNVGLSIYLHNLANGAPISPELSSPGARAALRNGQTLMNRKVGQLNMACVDCHTRHANKWVRGQYLVEAKGTTAHFPTWRTSRGDIWDIRKRFQWCNVSVRANELPPDAKEYGDIELALAALNKGEKINSPGIRH
ncbi:MAG: cytochrome c [Betaproteobacteria bacterium]|nr:cytochrome c [Betaproteobacteria bacterium]